jgi:hypothetical protein
VSAQAPDGSLDAGLLEQIEADLRRQLEGTRERMRALTREHRRALLLRSIYGRDPLTRERLAELTAGVDHYSGRLAELGEEERLLAGWLERAHGLRVERSAEVVSLPTR